MIDLAGMEGNVEFTLEIKRAATGKIETYQLVGRLEENGSNTLGGGASGSNERSNGPDRD
jgi:hypothetical protein